MVKIGKKILKHFIENTQRIIKSNKTNSCLILNCASLALVEKLNLKRNIFEKVPNNETCSIAFSEINCLQQFVWSTNISSQVYIFEEMWSCKASY